MLHLIPPPAHRAALRIAHAVRLRWWRWRKPRRNGCRVIALDAAGRVLLVRHSYGSPAWMPPGGGMSAGEDAVTAALRELVEETACKLDDAVLLADDEDLAHGSGARSYTVGGYCVGDPRPDLREIVEVGLFALDALPQPISASLRQRLPVWAAQIGARSG
jgi:8-oxo-dGTP pyrophosphatase MutT (NUDIX family)